MEKDLFDYLKRTGSVRGDIKYDFTYGYPRRKYSELRMSDVPSRYLDMKAILPNFNEIIDSMMTEAGKLKTIADIEETTEKANENEV